MERRTIGERRLETELLITRLKAVAEGETVSYDELNKAAGVNVQNGSRGLLLTAIKSVESELQTRFGTVRGKGVRRLPCEAWGSAVASDRDGVRRKAKRALSRSMRIDYGRLTPEQRAEVDGNRTILHFVARATTDNQTAKLTAAAQAAGTSIGFDATLKHFGK